MSGVTIGSGSIIAANTHVVNNVPPYSIVGGNPGKVLKSRFTVEQIESLLTIAWWNWPLEKIKQFANLLLGQDIDKFIAAAKA